MRPLSLNEYESSAPPPLLGLDESALGALNYVRLVALECRSAARVDLFQACAVLTQDKTVAHRAYAETLVKCLSQALGTKPVFYAPGVSEISFDEAWLVRLIQSSASGDLDSFVFLIRSRVPHIAQRNLAFLVHAMSDSFNQT